MRVGEAVAAAAASDTTAAAAAGRLWAGGCRAATEEQQSRSLCALRLEKQAFGVALPSAAIPVSVRWDGGATRKWGLAGWPAPRGGRARLAAAQADLVTSPSSTALAAGQARAVPHTCLRPCLQDATVRSVWAQWRARYGKVYRNAAAQEKAYKIFSKGVQVGNGAWSRAGVAAGAAAASGLLAAACGSCHLAVLAAACGSVAPP